MRLAAILHLLSARPDKPVRDGARAAASVVRARLIVPMLAAAGIAAGNSALAAPLLPVETRLPVQTPASVETVTTEPTQSPSATAVISYAESTDEQLTTMRADWSSLSAAERRALLTEVKSRMARQQRNQTPGQRPTVKITTTRRFGRVVRQPDGSLVRIETSVVQVRKAQQPVDGAGFGTGFENRHPDDESVAHPDPRSPAQTVKHNQP